MRGTANQIVLLLVVVVLTSAAALGKTIRKEVTFASPVTVNGTLVKVGTYVLTFDDETNQLAITKGKKVLAKAEARLEKSESAENQYVTRSESEDAQKPAVLLSVSLKDGNQATIVNNGDNKGGSMQ